MPQESNSRYIFSKNISMLQKRNSFLSSILEHKTADTINIIKTKTDNLSIEFNNILLHSKYNPVKEADTFASVNKINLRDKVMLYGFGLGYHLIPILEKIGEEGRLVIIECNLDILCASFSHMDLEKLFQYNNWEIIAAKEEMDMAVSIDNVLKNTFNDVPSANKKIITHNASFKCIPDNFPKIKNAMEILSIGNDTAFVFKDVMTENLKNNLDVFLRTPGIKQLFSSMAGKSVFLVGAGPSLDEALPFLQKEQNKAFVACVDTVFPILCDYNINVDMVFTVDPQETSFIHFAENLHNNAALIFSPVSASKIVKQYEGIKLTFAKKDQPLLDPVINELSHKGFSIAGGSVSCIALDIISSFKPDNIIFVGMDFGFPQSKAYSRHAREIKNITAKTHKFSTPEMIHRKIIKEKKTIYLDDKNGSKVATHQNMHTYLKNIEQIIRLNEQINYINFLSNGVQIKGAKYIYFAEEVNHYLQNQINKRDFMSNLTFDSVDMTLKEKIIKEIIKK